MDTAVSNGTPNGTLRHLNIWRIYLRLLTISDMLTVDGKQLNATILQRQCTEQTVRPNVNWPYQGPPSPEQWESWDTFCATVQPLTGQYIERDSEYTWFMDKDHSRLYKQHHNKVQYYTQQCVRSGRHAIMKFNQTGTSIERMPTEVYWAIVTKGRGPLTVTNFNAVQQAKSNRQEQEPLLVTLSSLPSAQWVFQNVDIKNLTEVLQSIQTNTARAVCDGSYNPQQPNICTSA